MNATIKLADVRQAARTGIDAVNALIDRVSSHSRVGKIEFEPGFIGAYQSFIETEYGWPSSNGPRP